MLSTSATVITYSRVSLLLCWLACRFFYYCSCWAAHCLGSHAWIGSELWHNSPTLHRNRSVCGHTNRGQQPWPHATPANGHCSYILILFCCQQCGWGWSVFPGLSPHGIRPVDALRRGRWQRGRRSVAHCQSSSSGRESQTAVIDALFLIQSHQKHS